MGVFEYHCRFEPDIDSIKERKHIIRQLLDTIGNINIIYLYLSKIAIYKISNSYCIPCVRNLHYFVRPYTYLKCQNDFLVDCLVLLLDRSTQPYFFLDKGHFLLLCLLYVRLALPRRDRIPQG